MPYGDLSYFMPKRGFFKEPGQYERALKGEATKKASYMADVEQFYTQIEESGRQFDVGLGESGRQFDLNLALQSEGMAQQASQFAQQQSQQKSMFRDQFWGQIGAGALNTAIQAYLKDKDITFGFDWAEDIIEKYNILGTASEATPDLSGVDFGGADPGMWADPDSLQWTEYDFDYNF